jgi:predicted DNA-binding protein with PD1-like motif
MVGGHVFEAVASLAVEIAVLTALELIRRQPADFCDLKLIELWDGGG